MADQDQQDKQQKTSAPTHRPLTLREALRAMPRIAAVEKFLVNAGKTIARYTDIGAYLSAISEEMKNNDVQGLAQSLEKPSAIIADEPIDANAVVEEQKRRVGFLLHDVIGLRRILRDRDLEIEATTSDMRHLKKTVEELQENARLNGNDLDAYTDHIEEIERRHDFYTQVLSVSKPDDVQPYISRINDLYTTHTKFITILHERHTARVQQLQSRLANAEARNAVLTSANDRQVSTIIERNADLDISQSHARELGEDVNAINELLIIERRISASLTQENGQLQHRIEELDARTEDLGVQVSSLMHQNDALATDKMAQAQTLDNRGQEITSLTEAVAAERTARIAATTTLEAERLATRNARADVSVRDATIRKLNDANDALRKIATERQTRIDEQVITLAARDTAIENSNKDNADLTQALAKANQTIDKQLTALVGYRSATVIPQNTNRLSLAIEPEILAVGFTDAAEVRRDQSSTPPVTAQPDANPAVTVAADVDAPVDLAPLVQPAVAVAVQKSARHVVSTISEPIAHPCEDMPDGKGVSPWSDKNLPNGMPKDASSQKVRADALSASIKPSGQPISSRWNFAGAVGAIASAADSVRKRVMPDTYDDVVHEGSISSLRRDAKTAIEKDTIPAPKEAMSKAAAPITSVTMYKPSPGDILILQSDHQTLGKAGQLVRFLNMVSSDQGRVSVCEVKGTTDRTSFIKHFTPVILWSNEKGGRSDVTNLDYTPRKGETLDALLERIKIYTTMMITTPTAPEAVPEQKVEPTSKSQNHEDDGVSTQWLDPEAP